MPCAGLSAGKMHVFSLNKGLIELKTRTKTPHKNVMIVLARVGRYPAEA
jgi:hypothetical protein